jgi:hypothetical protein
MESQGFTPRCGLGKQTNGHRSIVLLFRLALLTAHHAMHVLHHVHHCIGDPVTNVRNMEARPTTQFALDI